MARGVNEAGSIMTAVGGDRMSRANEDARLMMRIMRIAFMAGFFLPSRILPDRIDHRMMRSLALAPLTSGRR